MVHIALLCAIFYKTKKKLKNICDFIWWREMFFVTLCPEIEACGTIP